MEFIELAGFILQFSYPYAKTVYGFSIDAYIALIVAGGVFLALHACKAAALFIMAKKQGKKKLLWCAFLPFANTFLIGELGGEVKFGNLRLKHVGVVAMLAELVFVACRGFVLGYYAYAFHNGLTYFEVENNMIGWGFNEGVLTDGMYTALNACEIAGYILSFVVIIAFIFVNIGILPVTGQTLPMISRGGTALIIMNCAFGIILSVNRTIEIKDLKLKAEKEETTCSTESSSAEEAREATSFPHSR